ncbi:hypothetical protein BGP_5630 [Beggiatoa sp. PS]|nr:hypothetical protein BGP_5630 [Beggiatoa sp. PS]
MLHIRLNQLPITDYQLPITDYQLPMLIDSHCHLDLIPNGTPKPLLPQLKHKVLVIF